MLTVTKDAKTGALSFFGEEATTWSLTVKVYQDAANTIPLPLSGFTGRGQVKKTAEAKDKMFNLVVDILPIDQDSNPNDNMVRITCAPEVNKNPSAYRAWLGVDLIRTSDGMTLRQLKGVLVIDPGGTNAP